jgi:hypothetical protein
MSILHLHFFCSSWQAGCPWPTTSDTEALFSAVLEHSLEYRHRQSIQLFFWLKLKNGEFAITTHMYIYRTHTFVLYSKYTPGSEYM